jgi:hypothetical protein
MIYPWVLYLHVSSVFLFFAVHGVSIGIVLKVRKERDPQRVGALLELSRSSVGVVHIATLLVLATGIALAFLGDLWGRLWVWTALVAFIGTWGTMGVFGTRYYDRARIAVGILPFYSQKKYQANPGNPPDIEGASSLVSSSRPIVLVILGVAGLAVMLWMMVFQPF